MSLRKRLLRHERQRALRTWLSYVEVEPISINDESTFATSYKFYPKSKEHPVEICVLDTKPLPKQIWAASIYRKAYELYCDTLNHDEMMFCACLLWSKSYMQTIR